MMLLEAINRLRTGGQKKRTNNDLQNTTQNNDWTTWTHKTNESERTCSETVLSSCSTNGTSRVAFATNQISREWGKEVIVITTNGTYPCSFTYPLLAPNENN
jgi:hypothetical protein